MGSNYEGRKITDDMVEGCAALVGRETAVSAVRALCRYYGGALVYVPARATNGAEEMRGVIADAVGDGDAGAVMGKLAALFGGFQLYIPMEKNAFQKELALEIYGRMGKDKTREMCREYGISFNQVYRLWKIGKKYKLQGDKEI